MEKMLLPFNERLVLALTLVEMEAEASGVMNMQTIEAAVGRYSLLGPDSPMQVATKDYDRLMHMTVRYLMQANEMEENTHE